MGKPVRTDPRREVRRGIVLSVTALVVVTGVIVGSLALLQDRARSALREEYGEQQQLLASQTARRLGDLADQISRAAARLQALPQEQSTSRDTLRDAWEGAFGTRGGSLDLLQAHDFEVVAERVRPHEHPTPHGRDPEAIPCHICIGEGSTLPVLVPLQPGVSDGPVVEIAIPLSELSRRLVAANRPDSTWWADRTSGLLLASPSSAYLGVDLRAAAGPCIAGLEPLMRPGGPALGTARYCWPSPKGPISRLAGFAGESFLGLDTVVGVSVEESRALWRLTAVQRMIRVLVALSVVGLVIGVAWLLLGGRARLLRERAGALASLSALSRALEARDRYTRFHSENVGTYAADLGRRLGLGAEAQEDLRLAGRMHDLGKIGICDGILNKPGALDDDERRRMEAHTEIGEEILGHLPWAAPLADVAGCHHERMDGTGYPHRLRGPQIPRYARIVAVADVLDALLTDRPYRDALPLDTALEILGRMAGSHLDPEVVEVLMQDPEAVVALGGGPRPPSSSGAIQNERLAHPRGA